MVARIVEASVSVEGSVGGLDGRVDCGLVYSKGLCAGFAMYLAYIRANTC
jgi:hypothetical protein